jgi:putative FmdB family regulatory protein
MPTYVYECSKCQRVFEKDQRITEDPIKNCDCGAEGTVKRLIQPIAVMFKGSGFHINDYSSKPETTTPPAETKTTPEPAPAATPAPASPAAAPAE